MANMINKEIEKIIKKMQTDSDKRMKRYLGSLDENTEHRFKATKEGLDGINEKLAKIEKTLNSHTEQIANILVDAHSIKLDMNDIKYQVKLNLDRKVDKTNFVDLESRIRVLEKK
jgi:uncharacterized protein (DUF885 family)